MKREVNRRTFIKMTGTAFGILALGSLMPVDELLFPRIEFAGYLFRGDTSGKLLFSADQGKSWQIAAKFGDHCIVKNLKLMDDQMELTLMTQGYPFSLYTRDGFVWMNQI
jgi:hypothetical protein